MAPRIDQRSNTISASAFIKLSTELMRSEREIAAATEELAAARGVRTGIFKRAKEAGADVDAIRLLQMLAKKDNEDRNRLLENTHLYAAWTGVALYVEPTAETPQGALFANDPEAVAAAEALYDARVSADGANSRRHGGSIDANPHEAGSRDHQTWATSFLLVDKEMAAKPQRAEVASTARRGRPPKAAVAVVDPEPKRPPGRPRKLVENTAADVRKAVAADDAAEAEPVPSGDVVHFPDPVAGWNN
jgi:uncharacterized protein (UPF0335 family)